MKKTKVTAMFNEVKVNLTFNMDIVQETASKLMDAIMPILTPGCKKWTDGKVTFSDVEEDTIIPLNSEQRNIFDEEKDETEKPQTDNDVDPEDDPDSEVINDNKDEDDITGTLDTESSDEEPEEGHEQGETNKHPGCEACNVKNRDKCDLLPGSVQCIQHQNMKPGRGRKSGKQNSN